jgi:hypothetical protein
VQRSRFAKIGDAARLARGIPHPRAAGDEIQAIDRKDGMRAITVLPGIANSARLDDVPEPPL